MSISRQNLTVVIVSFMSENVIHDCIQSIPKDIIKICESGINDSLQLNYYSKNGADAFLIGEFLMKSPDILEETRKLIKK